MQGLGIFLFTNGFLLTRIVLDDKSSCSVPPTQLHSTHEIASSNGCWHPKSFNKAVILIIDALRYDFTVPSPESNHHFHNALPLLHKTALEHPKNAFLRPFIADPPTTTLQRLKGLTTGTLPTFIEAGSNFAGNAIEEDNLIAQLKTAGKSVVQLGDDTWQKLFPGYFNADLTRPFDSFNVKDLHTVDNGVITHLMPLLHPSNASEWDVIIGHFLGVDHVGHTKGPDDPVMTSKLQQMNDVLTRTVDLIDDDTLLVVFGDHGMDSTGNHGGESDDEVEAALWMYSKKPFFGRSKTDYIVPPATAKERFLPQIDLVPTLALLLGLPVPFNNLGSPIEEAFLGSNGDQWENMAHVNRLTAAQVRRFHSAYDQVSTPDSSAASITDRLWDSASRNWIIQMEQTSKAPTEQWRSRAAEYSSYETQTLSMFKALWAQFDLISMSMGIIVLLLAIVVVIVYARSTAVDVADVHASLCVYGGFALLLGGLAGYVAAAVITGLNPLQSAAFASALLCSVTLLATLARTNLDISLPIPKGLWSWTCFLAVLLLAGGFGSNSYTVWEEEILLYMLGAFGTLMLIQGFRLKNSNDRLAAALHSVVFMAMIRVSAVSRLCREEQMPNCSPLFHVSSASDAARWRLLIPFAIAIVLPLAIKAYYDGTASYQASAPFWIGIGLRTTLFLIAVYWSLELANGSILGLSDDLIETIRTYIAQLVLAISVGAGGATFGWQAPLLGIEAVRRSLTEPDSALQDPSSKSPSKANGHSAPDNTEMGKPQVVIRGASNLYGSHFAILPFAVLLIPLLLLSKPMGQLALFCVTIAIFSLLELVHLLGQQGSESNGQGRASVSALGPTVLAILAHFAFFKTGHQAALASIQWDMAFAATKVVRYPWSPMFVTLNTFAGQILCAAAVPAVILWRRPFNFTVPGAENAEMPDSDRSSAAQRRKALLSDLAKAQLTHFLVYSVINLATTVFAAHLRRHLMLYRVFCPRWMLGGVSMVIAELAGCFLGIAGVGWTFTGLGDLFGW